MDPVPMGPRNTAQEIEKIEDELHEIVTKMEEVCSINIWYSLETQCKIDVGCQTLCNRHWEKGC
jgi:hypothetical protein